MTHYAFRRKPSTLGFSFLELVVVLALLGALIKMAIPNILELRSRIANRTSLQFYNRLKSIAINKSKQPVIVFNQTGGVDMGSTHLQIPEGVRLHYLIKFPTTSGDMLSALEVSHRGGSATFRQVVFKNQILEQVISK